MVGTEEDEWRQAVIVATGGREDPAEEITVVGSSTGGASEQPVQNVQKNPEKDPAEIKDQGTLEEQKQDQHEGEQQ